MMNPLVQALTRISFCTSEFIFVRRHREYLPPARSRQLPKLSAAQRDVITISLPV